MAARWRARQVNSSHQLQPQTLQQQQQEQETGMAAAAASSSRPRPQVYVHFEFAVGWSQKKSPKPHAVTYMSRNLRERGGNFPRHLPPPNTNFLAAPGQHQPRSAPRRHAEALSPQRRRHSRDPSYPGERGSSAPPPFNDSPWDAEPEPMSASVLPPRQQSQVWKDLPPAPPELQDWATNPDYYEDYEGQEEVPNRRYGSSRAGPSSLSPCDPDGKQLELEALSAAMMTVDNGFEDQWWNRGTRETVAGDLHTLAAGREALSMGGTVGWAIAREEPQTTQRPSSTSRDVLVSPITDYSTPISQYGSPPPSYPGLSRSLTTRSEELFIYM